MSAPALRPLPENNFERLPVCVFTEASEASVLIASEIASAIKEKQKKGEKCVLGLATGSSPIHVYNELVRLHKEEGLSFNNVVTFNLDEYYPIQPNALQSYVRFMHEYLFDHIDIHKQNIHIPDGTLDKDEITDYCHEYEQKIKEHGDIDIQLLGIGRTGHIGFNEPGSTISSKTRLITLDKVTKLDAASDFFGEEYVPKKAITMGIGSIFQSKRVIIMAWGEGKAPIVKEAVEGEISSQIPATFLQQHSDVVFVLDEAASTNLKRSSEPWLFDEVVWDDEMISKAVTTLCQKVSKSILKLTSEDYNDHGLSDLISSHGSAYDINIRLFNNFQNTITGWPGGKPNTDDSRRPERAEPASKKVLIFSPHPDDDVISMGGTLIRLVDQGHEVHVAYQTSGNIAVFDDDVLAYADFVTDYHQAFGFEETAAKSLFNQIKEDIANKTAGEIDSAEVRKIKGLIRVEEAKAACRYVGVPVERAHFMNMPFYETGLVKKKPIGKEDIDITVDLLRKIKPHQIYAAGDLSDPHGTHRVCLDAIFKALEVIKTETWAKDCWVWLYRGAWQEWEIDKIEMAVPISPDELLKKRRAIFKHQSQKDRPLFPGSDKREFWQRAEDRNRATAETYDQLGLAEYEAMEAFRRYHFM